MSLMIGVRPVSSTSSQWAPSKTGLSTQTAGSVVGRVLLGATGDVRSSPQPWRAA